MLLQRLRIIGALVAEQGAEPAQPSAVAHQPVPEIMAAFVTQMPQQGTIGFAHLAAHSFAHRVIGFARRQGDQAIVVAGHHACGMGLGRIGQEIEGQAALADRRRRLGSRQAPAQQGIEQPSLGLLHPRPSRQITVHRQVGRQTVMAAGSAQRLAVVDKISQLQTPSLAFSQKK